MIDLIENILLEIGNELFPRNGVYTGTIFPARANKSYLVYNDKLKIVEEVYN